MSRPRRRKAATRCGGWAGAGCCDHVVCRCDVPVDATHTCRPFPQSAYRTKSLESIDYMEGGKQLKLMDPRLLRCDSCVWRDMCMRRLGWMRRCCPWLLLTRSRGHTRAQAHSARRAVAPVPRVQAEKRVCVRGAVVPPRTPTPLPALTQSIRLWRTQHDPGGQQRNQAVRGAGGARAVLHLSPQHLPGSAWDVPRKHRARTPY